MGGMRRGNLWHLFGQADKQGLKVNVMKSVRNDSWGHFDLGEWFNTFGPLGALKCIRDRQNLSYNFDLWEKHTIENTQSKLGMSTIFEIRDHSTCAKST